MKYRCPVEGTSYTYRGDLVLAEEMGVIPVIPVVLSVGSR